MIVVCRNLRFLNNFPEISSKRSTSWNKFINVNTWSNATSANKPDPLSLVTESQSLPLDLLMCIKVVRGFIWTWSRLNMKCSIGPCWVLGQAGPGGAGRRAVNTIITDYPPSSATSCLLLQLLIYSAPSLVPCPLSIALLQTLFSHLFLLFCSFSA